jgi:hypothetical protein
MEVDRAPWQVFPVLLPSPAIANQFIERAGQESLQVRRGYHPSLEDWARNDEAGCVPECPITRRADDRAAYLLRHHRR